MNADDFHAPTLRRVDSRDAHGSCYAHATRALEHAHAPAHMLAHAFARASHMQHACFPLSRIVPSPQNEPGHLRQRPFTCISRRGNGARAAQVMKLFRKSRRYNDREKGQRNTSGAGTQSHTHTHHHREGGWFGGGSRGVRLQRRSTRSPRPRVPSGGETRDSSYADASSHTGCPTTP